ncbi:MAG: hypothetical protein Q9209_006961 [Squamulea sp. 1 TL-2023]
MPSLDPSCFRNLQALRLEDDLAFEVDDWLRWDSCIDWANIRELGLVCLPLILQVLSHCLHRLPNLHTLRLSVHRSLARPEQRLPLLDDLSCAIIKKFLSSNAMMELGLTGLTRDLALIDIVRGSGEKLRRLSLHVDDIERDPTLVLPGTDLNLHLGEGVFLDAEKLQTLNAMCPNLEHLGMDVEYTNGEILFTAYTYITIAGYASQVSPKMTWFIFLRSYKEENEVSTWTALPLGDISLWFGVRYGRWAINFV